VNIIGVVNTTTVNIIVNIIGVVNSEYNRCSKVNYIIIFTTVNIIGVVKRRVENDVVKMKNDVVKMKNWTQLGFRQ
jgi:hypothetical protein